MQTGLPGLLMPDGETFPLDPVETYLDGEFPKVDLLIGVTENEGYMPAESVIPAISSDEIDLAMYQQQLKSLMSSVYGNNVDDIYEEVVKRYFGGDVTVHDADFVKQQTAEIVGSIFLAAPTHLAAQYHSGMDIQYFEL